MPSEVLSFKSGVKSYGISSSEEPHSEQIGILNISEKYWPRTPSEIDMPIGVQNYELAIEATVSSREEAWEAKSKAFNLASDLDKAWVYACGEPLHSVSTTFLFFDAPEGWQTNANEVDIKLAQAGGQPYISSGEEIYRHWVHMPIFPLKEALKILEALKTASEATLALVDLHYGALKSFDSSGKLFLLAKGLELGAKFLGKNKKERDKAIPAHVKCGLKQSLDWLFDISNNRFDIRHVVKDPGKLQLHPKLTGQERADFIYDADLIIRSIVCHQIAKTAFVLRRDDTGRRAA
jgi:hypothetical protein